MQLLRPTAPKTQLLGCCYRRRRKAVPHYRRLRKTIIQISWWQSHLHPADRGNKEILDNIKPFCALLLLLLLSYHRQRSDQLGGWVAGSQVFLV